MSENGTNDFAGKAAVVTGAGSGIGLAIASGLAARGANVLVVDINGDAAAAAAGPLEGAAHFTCDVGDPEQVEAAVAAAVKLFGGVDIMVNNAGVAQAAAPIIDCSPELLTEVLRVNTGGVFHGIKYAAPRIAERGGGVIVSIASIGGLRGVAGIAIYGASKAAVISLTQTAALELQPLNIRVNCVCPGNIRTPMIEAAMKTFDEVASSVEELTKTRQGRWGVPEDIAGAVMALASDDMGFVSGATLAVDNGMSVNLF
jgi:NAD(P)-dependent dehydrogenase (short-subunit alcohol dehydrogenase family)